MGLKNYEIYLAEELNRKGEPKTWLEAQEIIFNAAMNLGLDRHKTYGAGNINKFKKQGVLVRLYDKLERLINIIFEGADDKGESDLDSFGDIINYSAYAIMLSERINADKTWWDLPYPHGEEIKEKAIYTEDGLTMITTNTEAYNRGLIRVKQ